MQIKVYNATEGDAALLRDIEQAVFTDAWSEAALRSHLCGTHTVSLLLTADGLPVGSLTAALLPPEGEVYRVAVLPAFRRRGFGRLLLAELLRLAKEKDTEELFIEVRAGNLPAQALYASFGFAEYGRRRDYYSTPREDAILMKFTSRKE